MCQWFIMPSAGSFGSFMTRLLGWTSDGWKSVIGVMISRTVWLLKAAGASGNSR